VDVIVRLVVLMVLLGAGGALTRWYRSRSAYDAGRGATDADTGAALWPAVGTALLLGDLHDAGPSAVTTDPSVVHRGGPAGEPPPATWVIFSTPLCVSCTAVQADLERHFPHHRVVKIDATERPDLAARYEVRRAPTTILADAKGVVVERLVGPEGVRAFIGDADDVARVAPRTP